jgi:hypothetical protein
VRNDRCSVAACSQEGAKIKGRAGLSVSYHAPTTIVFLHGYVGGQACFTQSDAVGAFWRVKLDKAIERLIIDNGYWVRME